MGAPKRRITGIAIAVLAVGASLMAVSAPAGAVQRSAVGMVADIEPGPSGGGPNQLINVNGRLFFRASPDPAGTELWKSDGTAAGPLLVADILPSPNGSDPASMVNLNGTVLFSARDGLPGSGSGTELWRSDGTAAGTVRVADINPGLGSSMPNHLTVFNGKVYFSANDGTTGVEPWVTDGTATGTVQLVDLSGAGTGSSLPTLFTASNGTLFFRASDGISGFEVYKTDGTAAGAVLVADINAEGSAFPTELIDFNGTLFFKATDGTTSLEL